VAIVGDMVDFEHSPNSLLNVYHFFIDMIWRECQ
jgi:hypothetical protein